MRILEILTVVWRLLKAIKGKRNAGRSFKEFLRPVLNHAGMQPHPDEPNVWMDIPNMVLILLWVDDFKVVGENLAMVD
eukprot:14796828-Alexandrium_andersonii.AAC.1